MAKALKCDRCSKFYIYNSIKHDSGVLAGIAPVTVNDTWYKKYDLCDECIAAFFEFMCGCDDNEGEDK